jgi:hypothetical protein
MMKQWIRPVPTLVLLAIASVVLAFGLADRATAGEGRTVPSLAQVAGEGEGPVTASMQAPKTVKAVVVKSWGAALPPDGGS